ncbi:hypothetical protein SI859A1_01760 [Aurantimonas manganoxydans SI85-9A1]|uniref:Uncharacterized protein n=1 Tax=Aurantimonas manganoxydans (strain ATCC BAA-1229 / DSM 21871 / SI85-9A1) TaxID=287752 RepID=Q1YL16_AURMS|nr:hypothetical protein SI859A1_01760 [Aurantimonas manganoxydans SI85-9A1]
MIARKRTVARMIEHVAGQTYHEGSRFEHEERDDPRHSQSDSRRDARPDPCLAVRDVIPDPEADQYDRHGEDHPLRSPSLQRRERGGCEIMNSAVDRNVECRWHGSLIVS